MGRWRRKRTRAEPPAAPTTADRPAGDRDPEDSQLTERLRRLDWPSPDPDVRERCFERILERVEEGAGSDAPPPRRRP
jgi:hypothetical protein